MQQKKCHGTPSTKSILIYFFLPNNADVHFIYFYLFILNQWENLGKADILGRIK